MLDGASGGRVVAVARPEHAHLPLDLFVSDAGIIGDAVFAGAAELVEDLARLVEREAVRPSQRTGEILDDAPVLPRLAGTVDRLVDLDHASFHLRHRAFVFFVQAARQHDVRVPRRVVEEEIDGGIELELLEAAGNEAAVGQGDFGIETD